MKKAILSIEYGITDYGLGSPLETIYKITEAGGITTFVVEFEGFSTRRFFYGKRKSYINPQRKCPEYIKIDLNECYRHGYSKHHFPVTQWFHNHFLYIGVISTFEDSSKIKIPNLSEQINIDIALNKF